MKYSVKIGIIGGTGLDNPDILTNRKEEVVDTPFGKPSDALIHGFIAGVPCVILARHGRAHNISPSHVNYRANIWALHNAGCTHVIVSTACGSLQEEIHTGDLVLLDSFIDRTTKREATLYGGPDKERQGICHLPMHPAFCGRTGGVILAAAESLGIKMHKRGTCVTIEGPRFSSKAESNLFRLWGGHVVNMTTVPEVVLAKEAGLCYAAVALVTDYDCWRESDDTVCVNDVLAMFKKNADKVSQLFKSVVPLIAEQNWDDTIDLLKGVVTGGLMGSK